LFLCVLAGFGFEYVFFTEQSGEGEQRRKNIMTAMVIYFGLMTFLFGYCLINPAQTYRVAVAAADLVTRHFIYIPSERSVGLGVLNGVLSSFLLMVMGAIALNDKVKKRVRLVVLGFLVLQTCHMTVYYAQQLTDRTTSVPDQLRNVLSFREMPFAEQRQEFVDNERSKLLFLLNNTGMIYWSTHSLLFLDQVHNHFRTDHWLKPLDQYMRAYWGHSLEKTDDDFQGLNVYRHLTFPLEHPASGKIAGFTESKLQFFTKAFFANSPEEAAGQITDADYHGDVLILSNSEGNTQQLPVMTSRAELAEDGRLKIPYKIESFSANQLTVTVDVPENQPGPVWMLYSDVWHSGWRAEINGQPVSVYQANLAYKAVSLLKGKNTVRFFFSSKLATIIQTVIQWNSLLWLILILVLLNKSLFSCQKITSLK
ncbi:MAG: hypothetical protein KC684_09345, partial [Candidatus Omnitrophica bacterium]|nr:hypothetical protein [Candidatus Omnitrophota bacterium]